MWECRKERKEKWSEKIKEENKKKKKNRKVSCVWAKGEWWMKKIYLEWE